MNCKRCFKSMEKTWNGWELCDSCGYRYNTFTQTSPDDNKSIDTEAEKRENNESKLLLFGTIYKD